MCGYRTKANFMLGKPLVLNDVQNNVSFCLKEW